MMIEQFIIGILLLASLILMLVFLEGTILGGFREVEPRAEDEILVNGVRKNGSSN